MLTVGMIGTCIYGCSIFGARLFKQESCFISFLLLFSLTFYFFIFALLVLKIQCKLFCSIALFKAALNLLINIDFLTCYATFLNLMSRMFAALLILNAGLNLLKQKNI